MNIRPIKVIGIGIFMGFVSGYLGYQVLTVEWALISIVPIIVTSLPNYIRRIR